MANLKGCFSHKTDDWKTPKNIYKKFVEDTGFFDPCPFQCEKWNGLEIEWDTTNFVNPPYSQIEKWVDKAIEESEKGNYIVMLLPVRTDTKWFKKLSNYGVFIQFITGRLHFNESKTGAPFPSMLVWLNTLSPKHFEAKEINV